LSSAYCPRPWKAGFHLDHKIARNAGGTDDAKQPALALPLMSLAQDR
jgi:hypothetical protein